MIRPFLLSAGWLALVAVFFRWWDVTARTPGLALWAVIFLGAFVLTVRAVTQRSGLESHAERWRMLTWGGVIVLAFIGETLVPQIQVKDAMVRTTVFVKVLDTVIPLWILVRAMMVIWPGRARIIAVASIAPALAAGLYFFVVSMPGSSMAGPLPPLTPAESALAVQLEIDVRWITPVQGERNHRFPMQLDGAASYLEDRFGAEGYPVVSLPYLIEEKSFRNLEVTIPGGERASEIVVIGAHYDAVEGAPGADDNASGTAALLGLARAISGKRFARTVRLVAFTNEEPPFFNSEQMGSRVYAKAAAERGDDVVAMISLETVGYYSDEAGSQKYPPPFSLLYPDRGNFIGFVGNIGSRSLVRRAIRTFRQGGRMPSEGVAAPALVPGIGWSDHEAFWRYGWQAIMISDTAPFRNPYYHQRSDTPEKLDYRRMARVVTGLTAIVEDLAARQIEREN